MTVLSDNWIKNNKKPPITYEVTKDVLSSTGIKSSSFFTPKKKVS